MNQILNNIQNELSRLDKNQWFRIIEILHNNFSGYPFNNDAQEPAENIHQILKELDPNDDMVEDRFIYRLHRMACFTFRATCHNNNNEQLYWNPLQETYTEFMERNKNTLTNYQADQEHPSTDIIRSWLYQQIKHGKSVEIQ